MYASYAVVILKLRRSAETEVEHGLHLERLLGGNPFDPHGRSTVMQVLIGVVAILIGAYVFVDQIVFLSQHANLSPGVLSLILSPLATELPEKYNAVVWIRQSKDNLALANITGAMVFQSCIPVALGPGLHAVASEPPRSCWAARSRFSRPRSSTSICATASWVRRP